MRKKPEDVEYGKYLRGLREALGLDQTQFAARIGKSAQTIKLVELGHQALGKSAKQLVEILARDGGVSCARSAEHPTSAPAGERQVPLRVAARLMVDESAQEAVRKVADALSVSLEKAAQVVIETMANNERGQLQ